MINFIKSLPLASIETLSLYVNIYAIVTTVIFTTLSLKKLGRLWKTRYLRNVWGIKDGDNVVVICSELDDPEERQHVEPREFIYNLKYGDVDAYFEVVVTLLRLFPNIKLRVLSAGEAEDTRIDLACHLILIGGPDYNMFTERILERGITQFEYRSPYVDERSTVHPDEIVLYDKIKNREHCELIDERDFGYFERIKNPDNPDKKIILIGGCHTIGVAGAIKAFSMVESEQGETPRVVLANAKKVSRRVSQKSKFSVLVSVERVGQTINVPVVQNNNINVANKKGTFFQRVYNRAQAF